VTLPQCWWGGLAWCDSRHLMTPGCRALGGNAPRRRRARWPRALAKPCTTVARWHRAGMSSRGWQKRVGSPGLPDAVNRGLRRVRLVGRLVIKQNANVARFALSLSP
jgi:hypothetical protein